MATDMNKYIKYIRKWYRAYLLIYDFYNAKELKLYIRHYNIWYWVVYDFYKDKVIFANPFINYAGAKTRLSNFKLHEYTHYLNKGKFQQTNVGESIYQRRSQMDLFLQKYGYKT
jgi:hypothetical protein